MTLDSTPLAGLFIAETRRTADHRGSFARLFCESELAEASGGRRIVQINQSLTRKPGAVRGMHFQHPPFAEMKLVRCLRGRMFDVAVDLRRGSPTFLQWHGAELSADNGLMMIIPEGLAHGFQALEAESELLYLHSAPHAPSAEGGVSPLDPLLGIDWPLPVGDLSQRDRGHPPLAAGYAGVPL